MTRLTTASAGSSTTCFLFPVASQTSMLMLLITARFDAIYGIKIQPERPDEITQSATVRNEIQPYGKIRRNTIHDVACGRRFAV